MSVLRALGRHVNRAGLACEAKVTAVTVAEDCCARAFVTVDHCGVRLPACSRRASGEWRWQRLSRSSWSFTCVHD